MMTSLLGVQAARADAAPSPRAEYPRPQFDRSRRWLSLNGDWEFRPQPGHGGAQRIVVPFAWETTASGVAVHWLERARYARTFSVPPEWGGSRIVLNFGAVHYEATVTVDGAVAGVHRGGYTPFEFDITGLLGPALEHDLTVDVFAPNDKRAIAHGKQRSVPRDDYDGCAFTPSSGIWQTVWLESRPATHLESLALQPDAMLEGIIVSGNIGGPNAAAVSADVRLYREGEPGTVLASLTASADALSSGLRLDVPRPELWSPVTPVLYRVSVDVTSVDGADHVESVTGLRRVETREGAVFLNGTRISLRGVLDQGYWPDTGITAPDDAAFVRDLELAKAAGFNMVRKHLKLEDPRFYAHADRLGMLVWAEPASTGKFSETAAKEFEDEAAQMVRRCRNHPSIIIWGLYNEEWGLDWALPEHREMQEAVRSAVARVRALDDTRPIVDNSGWAHIDTDIADWHVYDEQPGGWAGKVQRLVSELGDGKNPSFPVAVAVDKTVQKSLMAEGGAPADVPFLNSEFGGGWTSIDRGWNLHWQTQELRRHDVVAGWVWTELYDIEHESAGILTAGRVVKDDGGRPPADANAETAVVFDVVPEAPGRDVIAPDGTVHVDMRVSHHGPQSVTVEVVAAWGTIFSGTPEGAPFTVGTVSAAPFRLSDPVTIRATLPRGERTGRLHVTLVAEGARVGRGALDIARE